MIANLSLLNIKKLAYYERDFSLLTSAGASKVYLHTCPPWWLKNQPPIQLEWAVFKVFADIKIMFLQIAIFFRANRPQTARISSFSYCQVADILMAVAFHTGAEYGNRNG